MRTPAHMGKRSPYHEKKSLYTWKEKSGHIKRVACLKFLSLVTLVKLIPIMQLVVYFGGAIVALMVSQIQILNHGPSKESGPPFVMHAFMKIGN